MWHLRPTEIITVGRSTRPLAVRFAGANPKAKIEGVDPLPGRSHYLRGQNPQGWIRDVHQFRAVRYKALYPGIDAVIYHDAAGQTAFDFIVAPSAEPERIRLAFAGAEEVQLLPGGSVRARSGDQELRISPPRLYQQGTEGRREIPGGFERTGPLEVRLRVGAYDTSLPLIVDPVLNYSTLLGGGGDEVAFAVAADAAGNAFLAGYTSSADLPFGGSFHGGPRDAFVAKLNSLGTAFDFVTYLGGSGDDLAYGVAVDSSGYVYVAGTTASQDFPVTAAAWRRTHAASWDGFIAKLLPSGSGLSYSTFVGGSGDDWIYSLALDTDGSVTVTGETASTNFPITSGAWRATYGGGLSDAFVTRLNAGGTAAVYSTYLGGSQDDVGLGVALDSNGNAYVAGYTQSANFPVTSGAYQTTKRAGYDAFVSALTGAGTSALYSTFLGGADADFAVGIAVDASGSAYVTGYTASADLPRTAGVVQTTKAAGYDAFVAKLASAGNALTYSTFLGGNGDDYGLAIALDAAGNVYLTGDSASSDFPTTPDAFQTGLSGLFNAFLVKLNPNMSARLFSSLFGGGGYDTGYGLALDPQGRTYVSGTTVSADFPTTAGAAQRDFPGAAEAFLLRTTVVNITPAPGVPSPSAGSGTSRTFTFTFSDPQGWQDLDVVNILINDFLDGRRACYLAYVRAINVLYLVNDTGDGLLPGLVLNGTGSVSNSQCTVSGAGSSATGSGSTLTLTLNLSFSAAFAGNRIIYLAARDGAAHNSGWVPAGVWNVPGLPGGSPAVGSVSPNAGRGRTQTFVFTFTDGNGWQNLGVLNILINDYLDGRHGCYLAYSRPLGVLYLVNDPGNALLPELYLGTNTSVSNSQCTVYGAGSSAVGSGNTLTLTLTISFNSSFAGDRIIYMAARDVAERNSGWQAMGRWRVP